MNKYEEIYESFIGSKDEEKMEVLGAASKWAFAQVESISPKIAQQWLDKLSAAGWNNYLSATEAEAIVSRLMHQNGQRGERWSLSEIESLGVSMCEEPYFNKYALYATMNMLASDHWESISATVPEAELPALFYAMAVEKLKDPDRPKFIRTYFNI